MLQIRASGKARWLALAVGGVGVATVAALMFSRQDGPPVPSDDVLPEFAAAREAAASLCRQELAKGPEPTGTVVRYCGTELALIFARRGTSGPPTGGGRFTIITAADSTPTIWPADAPMPVSYVDTGRACMGSDCLAMLGEVDPPGRLGLNTPSVSPADMTGTGIDDVPAYLPPSITPPVDVSTGSQPITATGGSGAGVSVSAVAQAGITGSQPVTAAPKGSNSSVPPTTSGSSAGGPAESIGRRREELRAWLGSFVPTLSAEVGGLGPETIVEAGGAIRAVYRMGGIVDFGLLTESAVTAAGGVVTGGLPSAQLVQASFPAPGASSAKISVIISLSKDGLTILAR